MGREFEVIARLARRFGRSGPGVEHGIGSDCAILSAPSAPQIISIDTLIEGVHFDTRFMTFEDAGYRAVTTCLSDLAAGGADPSLPLIALAALTIRRDMDDSSLRALENGVAQAFDEFKVTLAGGDTVVAPGPLALTFTVIGYAPKPLTRSGAKPGHSVMVAGYLGGAGAALRLLQKCRAANNNEGLFRAYRRPRPLLELGFRLAEIGASACADVSDGLLADAGRIAEQSGLGMTLDLNTIPMHPDLTGHPDFSDDKCMELAATFGDDYALVFACAPDREKAMLDSAKKQGLPCAKIGECTKDPAGCVNALWRGKPFNPAHKGYEH